MINIRRDIQDSFYRYKMPPIQSKIEGKGNGIKTVVPNMIEVARALARSPIYVTKFFGYELGAQTITDEKLDRYIINGAHDAGKLQDLLDIFINKFVLCQECKNPETEYIVDKRSQTVTRDCKACGQKSAVDPRHKLQGVIVKNPPKKSKKGGKVKSLAQDGNGGDEAGVSDASEDDDLYRKINEEAALLPDTDRSQLMQSDWAKDVSQEAVQVREKEAEAVMKVIQKDPIDDAEEDENSPYEQFGEWILENKNVSDISVYKKASELNIQEKSKTLVVLAQTLFNNDIIAEGQIEKHVGLLTKLSTSEKHQKALLGGIEALVGKSEESMKHFLPLLPKILLQLYNFDIISNNDVFLKWGAKPSRKYTDKERSKAIHSAAKHFLDWVAESEEESSSEE